MPSLLTPSCTHSYLPSFLTSSCYYGSSSFLRKTIYVECQLVANLDYCTSTLPFCHFLLPILRSLTFGKTGNLFPPPTSSLTAGLATLYCRPIDVAGSSTLGKLCSATRDRGTQVAETGPTMPAHDAVVDLCTVPAHDADVPRQLAAPWGQLGRGARPPPSSSRSLHVITCDLRRLKGKTRTDFC